MAVGKQAARRWCEPPVHRWPAAASTGRLHAFDQFRALEGLKVLADRGVGQAELGGQFGRGRRLGALQPFDDAALGTGEVGGDVGDGEQSNGVFRSASLRKCWRLEGLVKPGK